MKISDFFSFFAERKLSLWTLLWTGGGGGRAWTGRLQTQNIYVRNAKYFGFRDTSPVLVHRQGVLVHRQDHIARERLKRKIFRVSDVYTRYDPEVRERGGGFKTDEVGQGESKKSVFGRESDGWPLSAMLSIKFFRTRPFLHIIWNTMFFKLLTEII